MWHWAGVGASVVPAVVFGLGCWQEVVGVSGDWWLAQDWGWFDPKMRSECGVWVERYAVFFVHRECGCNAIGCKRFLLRDFRK